MVLRVHRTSHDRPMWTPQLLGIVLLFFLTKDGSDS